MRDLIQIVMIIFTSINMFIYYGLTTNRFDNNVYLISLLHNAEDSLFVNQTLNSSNKTKTMPLILSDIPTSLNKKADLGRPMAETNALKVYVFPDLPPSESTGEYGHFILDGIDNSHRLKRTHDIDDPDAVWVVDLVRSSCFGHLVPALKDRWWRSWNATKKSNKTEKPKPWKIFMTDMHDKGYKFVGDCAKEIAGVFNSTDYVHVARRHSVRYKEIVHVDGESEDKAFANLGKIRTYSGVERYIHGKVKTLRYAVRSDLVQCIETLVNETSQGEGTDIITLPRTKDVSHFWRVNRCGGGACKHRDYVSKALVNFSKESENSNYTIFVDSAGVMGSKGRKYAQKLYAEALLESKIVVVSQRDEWDDHYRLMEGLIAGAMIMTDPMQPLPYRLEDRKHVVVYRSITELKNLIKYYLENDNERLEIAKAGYNVAMRDHRSWTWLERIIFDDHISG